MALEQEQINEAFLKLSEIATVETRREALARKAVDKAVLTGMRKLEEQEHNTTRLKTENESLRRIQDSVRVSKDVLEVEKMKAEIENLKALIKEHVETRDVCPHCGAKNCTPDVVYANVENYGDKIANCKCVHCEKIVRVSAGRRVKVFSVHKSDATESDFFE